MKARRVGTFSKSFSMKARRYLIVFCLSIIAFTVLFNCATAGTNTCSAIFSQLNTEAKSKQTCSNFVKLCECWFNICASKCERYDAPVPKIHIAVVACGDRLEETLVNIKSAVLFTKETIKYHILADDENREQFRIRLDSWPEKYQHKLQYQLYPITYPDDGNEKQWKKLFKICATQRLFLPQVLPNTVDSILYVDTDILFLSPVEDTWEHFTSFNETQLSAMAPESESSKISWYSRFARHPYYGPTGLNSGVMLMNLTRFRNTKYRNDVSNKHLKWAELLVPLLNKYKYNITWGDQCLLNIIFHYNPDKLYLFPCKWNYRPDHCMYGEMCASALQSGVQVLHGCRGVYHNDKMPTFKEIFNTFKEYSFQEDYDKFFINEMKSNIEKTSASYCGRNPEMFTKNLRTYLST